MHIYSQPQRQPCVPLEENPVGKAGKLVVRRLGKRLEHLYNWAVDEPVYDHIWDLCCDHGYLGLHIYRTLTSHQQTVHLVDRVPNIIASLTARHHHLIGENLKISCQDASNLKLASIVQPKSRHLFIIAGISGETVVKIIAGLISNNAEHFKKMGCRINFLLSPNRKSFELRQYLQIQPFNLIREAFVSENDKHHEHLLLELCMQEFCGEVLSRKELSNDKLFKNEFSSIEQPKSAAKWRNIHSIGNELWSPWNADKLHYARNQFLHYQRAARFNSDGNCLRAALEYRDLLERNGDT
jgi:tRNA (adenine22-N1)-methyltransferase